MTMRAGFFFGAALAALSIWDAVPSRAATIQVAIDKVVYAPVDISARVGDTIEWSNKDIVAHTATARDKSWDYMIMPGKKQTLTLKKAGEIDYYCKFHPNMVGHISVKE
ncbi:MAG TPA: cupredoxin domain-containing protein [Pseudolabrys sp.]|nr:cupredoxin domain-containing protein [Pseudolabrys sp.]